MSAFSVGTPNQIYRREASDLLLKDLTPAQQAGVQSPKRRVLVIAGAGSGKTEVMARRVAWWVAVEGVPRESVTAFTFTERASEEMKFRIRQIMEKVTVPGEDVTLGRMYVGTIHGFCQRLLRELQPDEYHNCDILDEGARLALVQRGYHGILGLSQLQKALGEGQYATIEYFLEAYDLLNEYDQLEVDLSSSIPPVELREEAEWCKAAKLKAQVGTSAVAEAFSVSAARFYAYLRCRRFLDFSTSQSELSRVLRQNPKVLQKVRGELTHTVVDEVQDINVVQNNLILALVGDSGSLTAVGDHRQAIFGWRGGRVEIMAQLYGTLKTDVNAEVVELTENFRSTARVIDTANAWARTIGAVESMSSPDMKHGNASRTDFDKSHVAVRRFEDRNKEATWIANTIRALVKGDSTGARHDYRQTERGLTYSDVVVLLRSATDARTYMAGLETAGISAVFRAGPDLFSQPEVLLFLGVFGRMAGLDKFVGGGFDPRSLPNRIERVLDCPADPASVIDAACKALREAGLPLEEDVETRLLLATDLVQRRIKGEPPASTAELRRLRTSRLIKWLRGGAVRRVFPQTLLHLMLAEAGVAEWETVLGRGATAMFHLGAFSTLITKMETPGWTTASDFRFQVIALCLWGTKNARTEEAPLLVQPDAVTISTIHAAKGLEWAAVFLADVCQRRFPSQFARSVPDVPFEGELRKRVDPADLADNDNYDQERRLMYVALTRAERYLFVTCSGSKKSKFLDALVEHVKATGGAVERAALTAPFGLEYRKSAYRRDVRLVTSFSDLRYYFECPHDFYLRKVLGFSPTIDQAFGYGRGVHNLLRAIHSDPESWAPLAEEAVALKKKLDSLIGRGLFYLRYTVGEPADNMKKKAVEIVAEYVQSYASELSTLRFEPEREFETLIPEESVLVSGAIDLIRLDDPPRVTLVDFKSSDPESESSTKLDEEEMKIQVSLYGLAAKRELEYHPEQGLVRYLGEKDPGKKELAVNLDHESLTKARGLVVGAAHDIRERKFHSGPKKKPRNSKLESRCGECDFNDFCGMPDAKGYPKTGSA
ncbi:MAG: ATP-dependent DNA helicase [Terriglobales bacterium]